MARQASALVKVRFRSRAAKWSTRAVASVCAPSRLGQSRAIAGQGYGSMFVIRECFAVSLAARILGLASIWARWVATRGWMLLDAVALSIAFPSLVPHPADP